MVADGQQYHLRIIASADDIKTLEAARAMWAARFPGAPLPVLTQVGLMTYLIGYQATPVQQAQIEAAVNDGRAAIGLREHGLASVQIIGFE